MMIDTVLSRSIFDRGCEACVKSRAEALRKYPQHKNRLTYMFSTYRTNHRLASLHQHVQAIFMSLSKGMHPMCKVLTGMHGVGLKIPLVQDSIASQAVAHRARFTTAAASTHSRIGLVTKYSYRPHSPQPKCHCTSIIHPYHEISIGNVSIHHIAACMYACMIVTMRTYATAVFWIYHWTKNMEAVEPDHWTSHPNIKEAGRGRVQHVNAYKSASVQDNSFPDSLFLYAT